jgi:hypothetical protein
MQKEAAGESQTLVSTTVVVNLVTLCERPCEHLGAAGRHRYMLDRPGDN